MTKSVTIINTSNWQGENLIIRVDKKMVKLVPGEVLKVTSQSVENMFFDQDKETKPFKTEDGVQLVPQELKSGKNWPWEFWK